MPGILYVVATPIGNLEDVTLRALRVLREVSLIAAEDTRRTAKLLQHYSISTPTTSLHEHNEHVRTRDLIDRLRGGASIALVSDAGTPVISDPGSRLVAEAREAGIPVQPVPGASAVTAVMSVVGMKEDGFTFAGFAPSRSLHRKQWLKDVGEESRPVVFYEAPHRIRTLLADVHEVLGERTLAIGRELTKIHEELAVRPISQWLAAPPPDRGEFVLVLLPSAPEAGGATQRYTPSQIASEFGLVTNNGSLSRREAMRETARRLNLRVRDVFDALEAEKRSAD